MAFQQQCVVVKTKTQHVKSHFYPKAASCQKRPSYEVTEGQNKLHTQKVFPSPLLKTTNHSEVKQVSTRIFLAESLLQLQLQRLRIRKIRGKSLLVSTCM